MLRQTMRQAVIRQIADHTVHSPPRRGNKLTATLISTNKANSGSARRLKFYIPRNKQLTHTDTTNWCCGDHPVQELTGGIGIRGIGGLLKSRSGASHWFSALNASH